MATKKKAKVWKHENKCAHSEAMINVTAENGKPPAAQWAHLARMVIRQLRKTRPDSAPLALHFIAVSAAEMLEMRHDNAKLCLLSAVTLADPELREHQMELFKRVFKRPQVSPESFIAMFAKAIAKLGSKMDALPEGESDVELAPGISAKVIKKNLQKPIADGNPRWN